MKIIYHSSLNFSNRRRRRKQIIMLVFHYTGMQSEVVSIKRLCNPNSKVSCHYLINESGKIIRIVPEEFTSWHAGKSQWKNFKSINKFSIGIELVNPGHSFGYRQFPKKQIKSLIKLSKKLITKYNIKQTNIVGHSDIAPLRKNDPGEKFPWKKLANSKIGIWHKIKDKDLIKKRRKRINPDEKNFFLKCIKTIGYQVQFNVNRPRYISKLVKAFQRRFRSQYISGVIDQESLLIAKNISFLINNNS